MDFDKTLIAPCGIYCGACKTYIVGKCKGCLDSNTIKCTIYKCVSIKGLETCGNCQKFPCDVHYRKETAVYSPKFLDWKKA